MAYEYTREIEKALVFFKEINKYAFTLKDLFFVLNDDGKEYKSFLTTCNRFLKKGEIVHLTKGIYAIKDYRRYKLEFEMLSYFVNRLRWGKFNYLSMENILSSWSIISECPIGYYTFMTTGRSGVFSVGNSITIEFVHFNEKITNNYEENLYFDINDGLFKAHPLRAFKDMLKSKRTTLDLVNMDELKEVCEKNFGTNIDHYIELSKTYSRDYPFFTGIGK